MIQITTQQVRGLRALFDAAAVFALAILAFFKGADLSTVQVSILVTLVMALVGDLKTSAAFMYDGVPDRPPETAS